MPRFSLYVRNDEDVPALIRALADACCSGLSAATSQLGLITDNSSSGTSSVDPGMLTCPAVSCISLCCALCTAHMMGSVFGPGSEFSCRRARVQLAVAAQASGVQALVSDLL
jgi:hypothetical protein